MGHAISRKMFSAEQAFVIGEILCGQTCTTYTRFSKFLRIKACHYVNTVPLKPPCLLFKVLPLEREMRFLACATRRCRVPTSFACFNIKVNSRPPSAHSTLLHLNSHSLNKIAVSQNFTLDMFVLCS